jgi:hypothetical protein
MSAGALTNLTAAVCSGRNSDSGIYWPWWCDSTSPAAQFGKQMLTGVIPSLISAFWDTYFVPNYMYLLVQGTRSCLSLSALDHAITNYFFWYGIINVFCGSIIGSIGFQQFGAVINEPGTWHLALLKM